MVQIAIYYATGLIAGILFTLGFQAFQRAMKLRRLAQMMRSNTPAAISQMMCPACFGAGGTAFGTCPTCKGNGRNPSYVAPPLPDGVLQQMNPTPPAGGSGTQAKGE